MKQTLLSSIDVKSSIIYTFIEHYKENSELDEIKSKLNDLYGWLIEVKEDIESNLLRDKFCDIVHNIIEDLTLTPFTISNNVFTTEHIEVLKDQLIPHVDQSISSYTFYKKLGFVNDSTVIVGANGCGKTSLATTLKSTLNGKDGIVIPAQKLLIVPTIKSVPNYANMLETYNAYQEKVHDEKQTYDAQKIDDIPYSLCMQYGSEYMNVLSTLMAERTAVRNRVCDKIQQDQTAKDVTPTELNSKLDNIIKLWNSLISHRTLKCEDNNIILSHEDINYPAHKMSEGEKIILYLSGRVLLAPENALIIVDEPEIYLHKTIVNKLWDKLEGIRNDCTFLYLTHDLHFASTRNAEKYWIKSYEYPDKWHLNKIEKNIIPEELLLKLLGSTKKILFCEGDENSHDTHIYEALFPDFTIISVRSCKDVINYTKAFNKLPNILTKALGIIDKDFRVKEQISSLKRNNIYTLEVAEVENLFLVEKFIRNFASNIPTEWNMEDIKKDLLQKLHRERNKQAALYVTAKVDYIFTESHFTGGKTLNVILKNYDKFKEEINIEKWHADRVAEITDIVKNNNYDDAIKIYNDKQLCKIIEQRLDIGHYYKKARLHLQRDEQAQNILREIFPKELSIRK